MLLQIPLSTVAARHKTSLPRNSANKHPHKGGSNDSNDLLRKADSNTIWWYPTCISHFYQNMGCRLPPNHVSNEVIEEL